MEHCENERNGFSDFGCPPPDSRFGCGWLLRRSYVALDPIAKSGKHFVGLSCGMLVGWPRLAGWVAAGQCGWLVMVVARHFLLGSLPCRRWSVHVDFTFHSRWRKPFGHVECPCLRLSDRSLVESGVGLCRADFNLATLFTNIRKRQFCEAGMAGIRKALSFIQPLRCRSGARCLRIILCDGTIHEPFSSSHK